MENERYVLTSDGELYHWGVKGMKWGVRRYQNKDGTLTPAGKKRQTKSADNVSRKKSIAKKVAASAIMTATVASAAVLYSKNPEAVNRIISKAGKKTVTTLKAGGKKTVNLGKKYIKSAVTGAKEGFAEGMKEAPKKAAKAVVMGVVMNAAKRGLDRAVGKSEAERIMKANNGKKIDSFWKVPKYDEEDDDD